MLGCLHTRSQSTGNRFAEFRFGAKTVGRPMVEKVTRILCGKSIHGGLRGVGRFVGRARGG